MPYQVGLIKRLGIGALAIALCWAPARAEERSNGQNAPSDNAQVAAIAFFNRIAQESGNPYIMAGARESAARLAQNTALSTLRVTVSGDNGEIPHANRVEVPIISQPDNSIAVPALINDKAMGTFIIDTGASYTVITPRLAAKLGVEIGPDTPKIAIITANGVISAPVVTLNNVTIGHVRVQQVQAVVQDLGKDLMLSGLLGLNFFKGKSLTIRQDRLILEEMGDDARLSSR